MTFRVFRADGLLRRWIGALGLRGILPGSGVLIHNRRVHTIGMLFSIDCIGLGTDDSIVAMSPAVPPWQFVVFSRACAAILEVAAGEIGRCGLMLGQRVELVSVRSRSEISS